VKDLQQAIQAILENFDLQNLKRSSLALSECYRKGESLKEDHALIAYLIVRLPATYAALCSVFRQMPCHGTFLDLGAGPGTAYWAAREVWNVEPQITGIEKEALFIELGKKLGSQVHFQQGDIAADEPFQTHDWTLFGYSLQEIAEKQLPSLLERSWHACQRGVIIVEPGTPRGYKRMLVAREYLIQKGGFVHAPCPHSRRCPLPSDDWCHFSVRLERTFLHRQLKQAILPFEDEKFSYVIVTKEKPNHTQARIIRPPLQRGGHTLLPLCTLSGLQTLTVSRSQKELYKRARKKDWGDVW
jgi:ribosomal protein RSM22 (predicted rRNA methylase)